jgi:hypothetical protein
MSASALCGTTNMRLLPLRSRDVFPVMDGGHGLPMP